MTNTTPCSAPRLTPRLTRAFTLTELLVVIGIIAVLIAILVPTLSRARESSRRAKCSSNLRQLATALGLYSVDFKRYPSSGDYSKTVAPTVGWSVHAKLLPYLNLKQFKDKLDFSKSPTELPEITGTQIEFFVCPSEPQVDVRENGAERWAPTSYGANFGSWFIYNPATSADGDGAFVPNKPLAPSNFNNMSGTIAFAEVKTYQPYLTGGATATTPANDPSELTGGSLDATPGHTAWADGSVVQSGFTTTFSPGTKVPTAASPDADVISQREGSATTGITNAAVTARSWHGKYINVAMMDGSVQLMETGLPIAKWRSLGTREAKD